MGREVAEVADRRAEVVGHRHEVVHKRAGVERELLEPVERQPRLAQERREDLRSTRAERLLLLGGGVEGVLGVHDQVAERALLLVQGAEHHAGVPDELPQAAFWSSST